jgi:hypothetical protein
MPTELNGPVTMSSSDTGLILPLVVVVAVGVMVFFPTAFVYVLTVVLAAAALAALSVVAYVVYWFIHNTVSPTLRVRAKVVRKTAKQWDIAIPLGESPEMAGARLGLMGRDRNGAAEAFKKAAVCEDMGEVDVASGVDCYVTFSFDGREKEFLVPMDVYTGLEDGSEGLLVVQGDKFRHFALGL